MNYAYFRLIVVYIPDVFPVMIGFSVEFPLPLEGVDCFPRRHHQYPDDINACSLNQLRYT